LAVVHIMQAFERRLRSTTIAKGAPARAATIAAPSLLAAQAKTNGVGG
jgi:hypothetical protein